MISRKGKVAAEFFGRGDSHDSARGIESARSSDRGMGTGRRHFRGAIAGIVQGIAVVAVILGGWVLT
jgi:hypothetical protein